MQIEVIESDQSYVKIDNSDLNKLLIVASKVNKGPENQPIFFDSISDGMNYIKNYKVKKKSNIHDFLQKKKARFIMLMIPCFVCCIVLFSLFLSLFGIELKDPNIQNAIRIVYYIFGSITVINATIISWSDIKVFKNKMEEKFKRLEDLNN